MESEEKMLRRYCGELRLSRSETHPTATFNFSSVEATISKSAKFRFVSWSTTAMVQLVEVEGSVLLFVPEPERQLLRQPSHNNKAVKWRSREVSAILDDLN